MSVALLALLIGCTPQDGEITDASYAAYMSQVSPNILTYTRVGEAVPANLTPIDCRYLDDESFRLDGVDYDADCTDGGDAIDPGWNYWLDDYAFYLAADKLTTWRVEASKSAEGDVQLLFHFDIPGVGDSRLGFSINPEFLPEECVDSESGPVLEQIDGDSWLDHWSDGQTNDDGKPVTVYMLNANSYQLNPSNQSVYWFLDQKRLAGTAFGRVGSDDLYGHGTDYTEYVSSSDGVPLYFPMYGGTYSANSYEKMQEKIADDVADNGSLATMGKLSPDVSPVEYLFEDNTWRPDSGDGTGLAQWVGASASWVKIDENPDWSPGKSKGAPKFSGEFQLALDGIDAGGVFYAHGKFKVYNLRDDVDLGYENLDEQKRAENQTPTCSGG